jgi:phosphatidylserine/phosphatidylglycerophosphate/cardiolipin synthase-like enzyme
MKPEAPFALALRGRRGVPFAAPAELGASRTGADDIRWLQSSLNQVLGLRLAVDGIEGPATRSAVRSFQQRQGLAADGIAGPNTEAALIAAGAPRPPSTVWAKATGGTAPSTAPQKAPGATGQTCEVLEYFAQDDDRLTAVHQGQVKRLAERLASRWETDSLRIIGHASTEGAVAYNHDLAQRRAEEVEFALVDAMENIQPGSTQWLDLKTQSLGEKPIAGISELERQRRVDICISAPARWFSTGGTPPMPPVRAGNDAQYLIGGKETFKAMANAIRTANAAGHYIYLLGWWLSMDVELIERNVMTTVHALFRDANASKVQIRAMLWDAWDANSSRFGPNSGSVHEITNRLSNGAAILDNRILQVGPGSHHQKVLIVKGEEGLIAFCGGIDINPDRIRSTGGTPGAPFQDVHCRIQGPAAHDLLKIFLERWQDHPDHTALDAAKGTLLGRGDDPGQQPVPIALAPAGNAYVQIARTYGNGNKHAGVPGGYAFARGGEQTARRMICKAIAGAKRFIYIEDQYLVSMDISAALAAALRAVSSLIVIILIPHADVTALGGQTRYRRQQFIAPLRDAVQKKPNRVGVFYLGARPKCDPGTYVHSKTMVIDDEFALIGSANLNRRSLTHDSEAVAAIHGPAANPLAKRLRQALWAKHLGMPAAALADGAASAQHWFAAPRGICVYDENLKVRQQSSTPEAMAREAAWNKIDPDGS